MDRKGRINGMIVAALLTSAFLAGCGGKEKQDGSRQGEGAQGQTDTGIEGSGQEEKNLEEGQSGGNVNLTFWCDESEAAVFEELLRKFEQTYQNEAHIQVTCETVAASDCKDTFLSDVENGADVFCMPDDQLLAMASSGVLEAVSNAQEIAGRSLEGAAEAASIDGKLYAYPLTADNGYFLYYDKRYFDEEDVQTLDRILEVCAQNNKKFVMSFESGWYLYSFFGHTGLEIKMNEDGLTNSCNWNAKTGEIRGVDIAEAMLDIAGHPGFQVSDASKFAALAKDGTAIAVVSGVWDAASLKEAFGGEYGACKLPTYTCRGKQVQMASFKGYRLVGVNSYSKNRGWAEKLADYLTSEESQKFRFEQAQHGPANKNAAASDEVVKVPAIAAVLEQADYGVLQQIGQKYWNPVASFGVTIAKGNPNGIPVQELMDQMVSGITE